MPECQGEGRIVISHVLEEDPAPAVQGCRACDKAFHIIVRYRTRPIFNRAVIPATETGEQIAKLLASLV